MAEGDLYAVLVRVPGTYRAWHVTVQRHGDEDNRLDFDRCRTYWGARFVAWRMLRAWSRPVGEPVVVRAGSRPKV